jgi:hypothetical protein
MAVVEQPPKGGDGVMFHRDSSHMHIHLAVLSMCDACALYAMDQSAMMARDHITIYGNRLCLVYYTCCVVMYNTHYVVVCGHVRPQEVM